MKIMHGNGVLLFLLTAGLCAAETRPSLNDMKNMLAERKEKLAQDDSQKRLDSFQERLVALQDENAARKEMNRLKDLVAQEEQISNVEALVLQELKKRFENNDRSVSVENGVPEKPIEKPVERTERPSEKPKKHQEELSEDRYYELLQEMNPEDIVVVYEGRIPAELMQQLRFKIAFRMQELIEEPNFTDFSQSWRFLASAALLFKAISSLVENMPNKSLGVGEAALLKEFFVKIQKNSTVEYFRQSDFFEEVLKKLDSESPSLNKEVASVVSAMAAENLNGLLQKRLVEQRKDDNSTTAPYIVELFDMVDVLKRMGGEGSFQTTINVSLLDELSKKYRLWLQDMWAYDPFGIAKLSGDLIKYVPMIDDVSKRYIAPIYEILAKPLEHVFNEIVSAEAVTLNETQIKYDRLKELEERLLLTQETNPRPRIAELLNQLVPARKKAFLQKFRKKAEEQRSLLVRLFDFLVTYLPGLKQLALHSDKKTVQDFIDGLHNKNAVQLADFKNIAKSLADDMTVLKNIPDKKEAAEVLNEYRALLKDEWEKVATAWKEFSALLQQKEIALDPGVAQAIESVTKNLSSNTV